MLVHEAALHVERDVEVVGALPRELGEEAAHGVLGAADDAGHEPQQVDADATHAHGWVAPSTAA